MLRRPAHNGIKATAPLATRDGIAEGVWGVGVCRACGATLVLGEGLGGRAAASAGVCASCRALPDADRTARMREREEAA